MRKLKINFDNITTAMSAQDRDVGEYYLDLETGKDFFIPVEVLSALEDDDGEELESLPDWEKEFIEEARAILADGQDRYEVIPTFDSREAFEWMEQFTATVGDDRLRELLAFALSGPKPFRRFKDALCKDLQERDRWFAFEADAQLAAAREWLESLEIEAEPADE